MGPSKSRCLIPTSPSSPTWLSSWTSCLWHWLLHGDESSLTQAQTSGPETLTGFTARGTVCCGRFCVCSRSPSLGGDHTIVSAHLPSERVRDCQCGYRLNGRAQMCSKHLQRTGKSSHPQGWAISVTTEEGSISKKFINIERVWSLKDILRKSLRSS